ncbi:hypothetical protein SAMN05421797_104150 [Maribacter ulvicola]|uniref:Uncharacterized protein n=1 Tax=Maribacter ulvicola TaxID=228959 RepID=A0A1N6WMG8_9FLAO|nr:hypothetical protein SAMN05421797_104150 [Maribacter ulvicola]
MVLTFLGLYGGFKETGTSITEFFPELPKDDNNGLVIAGIVGTTMTGVFIASRSNLVQEQHWGLKDVKKENKDAISSMVIERNLPIFLLPFHTNSPHNENNLVYFVPLPPDISIHLKLLILRE